MPNVRWNDPQTSYDALDVVAPKISDMHRRIIGILEREGLHGATPWELQRETGIIYNTVWRRLSELKEYGMVANTIDTSPNDRAFEETVVVLRWLISDDDYIPPRGTKSRLHKENELLRDLLKKVYARWVACRDARKNSQAGGEEAP